MVDDIRAHVANLDITVTKDAAAANVLVTLVRDRDLDRTVQKLYGRARARRIVGMDQQGAALAALGQHRQVVHPAVVAAGLAPADQQQLVAGRVTQRRVRMREVGQQRRRRQVDAARARAQDLRDSRLQFAEIDAVRRGLHLGQREAVRLRAEAVAVGA